MLKLTKEQATEWVKEHPKLAIGVAVFVVVLILSLAT